MEKKNTFFTEQIKKLMLEKGLTQQDLADKLNVTKANVSVYLNAKRNPKPATIHKIAKALNIKLINPEDKIDKVIENYNICIKEKECEENGN